MMKRILSFLALVAIVLSLFGTLPVAADEYGAYSVNYLKNGTTVSKEKADEVTITDYNGTAEDVIIPAKINGLPVTAIGDHAFSGCTGLTSITLPDSVTDIGYNTFENTGITDITVDSANPAFCVVSGILCNKQKTRMLYIPDGKSTILASGTAEYQSKLVKGYGLYQPQAGWDDEADGVL